MCRLYCIVTQFSYDFVTMTAVLIYEVSKQTENRSGEPIFNFGVPVDTVLVLQSLLYSCVEHWCSNGFNIQNIYVRYTFTY